MKALSKEIHNLHLSLLCSVDVEKAEYYIVKKLEGDEKLQCDLSFAFKCLEVCFLTPFLRIIVFF